MLLSVLQGSGGEKRLGKPKAHFGDLSPSLVPGIPALWEAGTGNLSSGKTLLSPVENFLGMQEAP